MTQSRQAFLTIAGISLILLVAVIAVGISRVITTWPTNPATPQLTDLPVSQTEDGTPIIGSPQAALTIIEFLDYSCYHCVTSQPTVDALLEEYVAAGKARLEIRILDGLDPVGSSMAAQAALCAGQQDAFLPMHRRLLALQLQYGRSAFTLDHIQQTASHLSLDTSTLLRCLQNETILQTVKDSTATVTLAANVQTLPAFLLQTEEGSTLYSAENIGAAINEALVDQ